jgi:glycosyltransferase involved in cell wall biosynthesis
MTLLVTHLTPHLGGGVGKALATLVADSSQSSTAIRHRILCLEAPEKTQFLDQIRAHGTDVIIRPNPKQFIAQVEQAAIVQLEWWNHPAIFPALCALGQTPMRLLVWCHTSGLYNPILPTGLLDAAQTFVFTSPCSYHADTVRPRAAAQPEKFRCISSASGFTQAAPQRTQHLGPLRVGYLGSLNFSKLHPSYVEYLAAVRQPNFRVRLLGDPLNQTKLQQQCAALGRPNLLEFRGYVAHVQQELAQMDVLAYLLNPHHYGTAENALLEAMAMGVVPVVLNNLAEASMVTDRQTGLIVDSPATFADAIDWLAAHPEERLAMGQRAAQQVASQFTAEKMQTAFTDAYRSLVVEDKRCVAFQSFFGETADAWFLANQPHPEWFGSDGVLRIPVGEPKPFDLLDANKGSAFQFSRYFRENNSLRGWATALEDFQ